MEKTKATFRCALCQFTAHYHHHGAEVEFAKGVIFLEDGYVTRDPFSPERDSFLVIGGDCSVCKKPVCCGQKCSLFYTKRFCMNCAKKNLCEFPDEIKQEIAKNSE